MLHNSFISHRPPHQHHVSIQHDWLHAPTNTHMDHSPSLLARHYHRRAVVPSPWVPRQMRRLYSGQRYATPAHAAAVQPAYPI
eukprot:3835123-Pleurochrysis_carterae.AAC.1